MDGAMGGLSGPLPSPDAVRPERSRSVEVSTTAPTYRPAPLVQWRESTADAWTRFWESELIGVAINADVPSMQRLFSYYDLWERAYISYAQEAGRGAGNMLGITAKGEEKVHPMLVTMIKLDERACKLEERFGITPYLRAKLGIKVGGAINTAAKLNAPARRRAGAVVIDVEGEEVLDTSGLAV